MRRAILAILSTIAALVMLLSFKTHGVVPVSATPPAVVSGTTSGSGGGDTGSGSTGATTVTGDSVNTRFGPVQVRVTVTNGKVTAVDAIDYPQNNPRDQQINSYAIPQLNLEAQQAGNASIDMVSGATYTSEGYIGSLQSALDQVDG